MSKMSRTIDQPIIDLATFDLEEFLSEFDLLTDTDIDEATDVTDKTDVGEMDDSVVTTDSAEITKAKAHDGTVVKSTLKRAKVGQKLRRPRSTVHAQAKLQGSKELFNVVSPNMSLTTTDTNLYAFPRFNKCDALLYFPSTMASYMNSGDLNSLSELFTSQLHNNCPIQMTAFNLSLLPSSFLEFSTFLSEVFPDVIMCMHFTRVVDDEIRSKLYFKATSNRVLYESVTQTMTNSPFAALFPVLRSDHLKLRFDVPSKPAEERLALIRLIDADEDVVMYGTIDFRLVIDEQTRKVKALKLDTELTSFKRSCDVDDVDGGV